MSWWGETGPLKQVEVVCAGDLWALASWSGCSVETPAGCVVAGARVLQTAVCSEDSPVRSSTIVPSRVHLHVSRVEDHHDDVMVRVEKVPCQVNSGAVGLQRRADSECEHGKDDQAG